MSKIIVRNEDCRKTIKHMISKGIKVDCVLTSPPYNISKCNRSTDLSVSNGERRYKFYNDNMKSDDYIKFITNILKGCERILKKNGTIILNLSYSSKNNSNNSPDNFIALINNVINNSNLSVADIICWKNRMQYLTMFLKINLQEYVNIFLCLLEKMNT